MSDPSSARRFGPSAVATPANGVTAVRLVLAPVAFAMMANEPDLASWPLVGLWFALSTSDLLDGYLARRFGRTRSGAFLDPLADKILGLGGIGMMCALGRFPWVVFVLLAVREGAVSWRRAGLARRGLAMPASKLAKWKTTVQLAAVGWVTLPPTNSIRPLADVTLWLSVVIAVVSWAQYWAAGDAAATTMDNEPGGGSDSLGPLHRRP